MSLQFVCLVGSTATGTCNAPVSGHPRTFTGTWQTGSGVMIVSGIPVVRVGDTGITDCGHHMVATTGSGIFSILGIPVHRVTDSLIITEGGSGTSITGNSFFQAP